MRHRRRIGRRQCHQLLDALAQSPLEILPALFCCFRQFLDEGAQRALPRAEIRSQVLAFWEEMDAAQASWHFHSYSGVRHGFTNPHPTDNPATAYDASADRQSWTAMLELFDEVFG